MSKYIIQICRPKFNSSETENLKVFTKNAYKNRVKNFWL